jgi:predicted metal-dependent phosphoesterase TrpH
MHTHTEHSPDSRSPLPAFIRRAAESGLGAVCVTDHNTVDGALRLRDSDTPLRVIVGEEIYSADGEIIGLFLERAVPPHRSAEETMDLIHQQGGLVYIPHPFSRNRTRHLRRERLERLRPQIDAIEVFNAREAFASSNAKALAFAIAQGIPGGVGSDAHRLSELGRAYIQVRPFTDARDLLEALREGQVTGALSGIGMHLRTFVDIGRKAAVRWARRLSR